jgi:hypothetical protein
MTLRECALCIVASLTLGGCVQALQQQQQAQPFARLDDVLVNEDPAARPVAPGETGQVEITRNGSTEPGRPDMDIAKGDAIKTSTNGVGVLTLQAGWQVIMDPGTDLTIENPSLFVRVGRIIVKKIGDLAEGVREALTVKTEIGAAAVEGTEFVFEVTPSKQIRLTVLTGVVKVYPRAAEWRDTTTYTAGQRSTMDARRIIRQPLLTRPYADSVNTRVRAIERTARPNRAWLRAGAAERLAPVRPSEEPPPRVVRPEVTQPVTPAEPYSGAVTAPRAGAVDAIRRLTCTVPNLYRMTEQDATKAVTDGRFEVGEITRTQGYVVVDQTPKADSSAVCGSKISFTLGTAIDLRRRIITPGVVDTTAPH